MRKPGAVAGLWRIVPWEMRARCAGVLASRVRPCANGWADMSKRVKLVCVPEVVARIIRRR